MDLLAQAFADPARVLQVTIHSVRQQASLVSQREKSRAL
jgi:hypothetical protein